MRDEELQRVLRELDSAAELIRRHAPAARDHKALAIQGNIAEIRRELAVYRAIVQLRGKRSTE